MARVFFILDFMNLLILEIIYLYLKNRNENEYMHFKQ